MTGPVWYPVSDRHPRLNARVVVKWDWREIEVVRIMHRNARRWARLGAGGGLEVLPPKGDEARQWDTAPFAWRPAVPDTWPDPLPERLVLLEPGRFVDIRPHRQGNKHAAMARQADAAERARSKIEQAIDGDSPCTAAGCPEGSRRASPGWFLEPRRVKYAAPGQITIEDAEGRVCRAVLTDGLKPGMVGALAQSQGLAALSAMVHDSLTSADADRPPRFQPTPRDIDDYLVALGWFAVIAPIEERPKSAAPGWLAGRQRAIVYRAHGLSYRQIASREGGSHEQWRRTYASAIDRVWHAANGRPVSRWATHVDQVAALRARNRAYHRGE